MPLFKVQDSEIPLYVIAEDFNQALAEWRKKVIALGNPMPEEQYVPDGIMFICHDADLMMQPYYFDGCACDNLTSQEEDQKDPDSPEPNQANISEEVWAMETHWNRQSPSNRTRIIDYVSSSLSWRAIAQVQKEKGTKWWDKDWAVLIKNKMIKDLDPFMPKQETVGEGNWFDSWPLAVELAVANQTR